MMLIHELGDDADLLVRQDSWLEQQRRETATKLDRLTSELRSIILAQRIKSTLQQRNMVAVLDDERDQQGEIACLSVLIKNLPDALKDFDRSRHDPNKRLSAGAQIAGWKADGHDVEASRALRD